MADSARLVFRLKPPTNGRLVFGLADGQENTSNRITLTNLPAAGSSGNDFGERAASLSGSVWLDADNDGVRDAGENGIAGVSVSLPGPPPLLVSWVELPTTPSTSMGLAPATMGTPRSLRCEPPSSKLDW